MVASYVVVAVSYNMGHHLEGEVSARILLYCFNFGKEQIIILNNYHIWIQLTIFGLNYDCNNQTILLSDQ